MKSIARGHEQKYTYRKRCVKTGFCLWKSKGALRWKRPFHHQAEYGAWLVAIAIAAPAES